jgi:hypothetical protein
MQPDVSIGVLTAGGMVEPRADWTEKARENLIKAIKAQQASRGTQTKISLTPDDTGADVDSVNDLMWLHNAVGNSIKLHKYLGANLPTKKNRFDWTLGEPAVAFGAQTGFDYALFLHAQDSFSSGGRVALQMAGVLGCVVGVCVIPTGGQQVAFASLVDLKTGRVVWFNVLSSGIGDMRDYKGAASVVNTLLKSLAPTKKT